MGIGPIRGVSVMEEVVMAPEAQDSVRARAIEWHIRLRDGDGEVWDAFADWLAENPHHGQVYDEIERTDLAIEPLLADVAFREAANDTDGPLETPARPVRRWGLVGGALAASIAVAVVLAPQLASDRYEVATRAGERHMVTLDPATQVILNGSTRMTFDRNDARFASLAKEKPCSGCGMTMRTRSGSKWATILSRMPERFSTWRMKVAKCASPSPKAGSSIIPKAMR